MTPLIGFAPDADPTAPGVIVEAQNVIPSEYGLKGAPSAVSIGLPALAAECRGAALVTQIAGTTKLYAGTTVAVYDQATATTWTDRSRGAAYVLGADDRWHFAQFGDSTLAAWGGILQRSTGGAFADVAGAPSPKIIVTAAGFAVALNTTTEADEWYCSAYLDETDWTLAVSTQCVKGRLVQGPGDIRAGMRLGDDVIAYKRDSMYQGRYQGAPAVWAWTQVSADTGCVGIDAVVSTPQGHIFLGTDNLYLFDGSAPKPLATGEIRRWLAREMSGTYAHRAKLSFDRDNYLVWVHFPGAADSTCTRCVVYHVLSGRWGVADQSIEAVVKWVTTGVTYDGGTPLIGTFDGGPSIPFDSTLWNPGREVPAIFNTSHLIQALSGVCASAYVVTGDFGDDTGFTYCDELRVRYTLNPTTSTVTGEVKDEAGVVTAVSESGTLNNGKHDIRQRGRWHRFKVSMTGDFHLSAVRPRLKPAGMR